jgi:hypothetical protein
MPIYEFYCPDNHKIYSFLARSLAYSGKTPRCPDNPKLRMERMISRFAVTGRAKEEGDTLPGSGPDDTRMEAAMAEMEREFGGMDSENPDPRQVARLDAEIAGNPRAINDQRHRHLVEFLQPRRLLKNLPLFRSHDKSTGSCLFA